MARSVSTVWILQGTAAARALVEVAGHTAGGLLAQLGEGKLGRSVDGHEEVELALFGSHFGNVDGKEANRITLELGTLRLVALGVGQTRDAFAIGSNRWRSDGSPLEAAVRAEERVRCGIVGWRA
jgi:hypothetical protein